MLWQLIQRVREIRRNWGLDRNWGSRRRICPQEHPFRLRSGQASGWATENHNADFLAARGNDVRRADKRKVSTIRSSSRQR